MISGKVTNLEQKDVCIVIPTVEIDDLTRKCATFCIKYAPMAEILIVADNPPKKAEPLEPFLRTAPNLTIAAKRNLAATLSKRSILAFIDSDAFPHPLWLNNALELFNNNPKYKVVSGPNIAPINEPLSQKLVGLVEASNLITINAHFIKKSSKPRNVKVMPSCNFLIRREAFIQVGMMNEALFGGEDFELCSRIGKKRWLIRYDGGVIVYHKSRNIKSFLKKRLAYGGFAFDNAFQSRSAAILTTLCPAFLILFLASYPLALSHAGYKLLYEIFLMSFFAVCFLESIRICKNIKCLVPTFLLIVAGIITPGLGTLARMLQILPSYKTIYRNYE